MNAIPEPRIRMRSWLFAPGDSGKKMLKATESDADIVIFDLEDAVVESGKADARAAIAEFLAGKSAEERARLWVRVNPLDGQWTADDLAAVMPAGPGGIMLPKSRGRHDVEQLDSMMSALEQENGIEPGSTPVIALVTETAAAMFTTGDYGGLSRLAAMTWGAEDLADSLGAQSNKDFEGEFAFTYKLARSLCLLGAVAAEVVPVETIDTNFRDLVALRKRAIEVRRQGYRGMLAIHPAQVPVINEAFTPTEEEVAEAREIVDLFAANPGAGTIGWKGGMLDRPHLSRARHLLAQVED